MWCAIHSVRLPLNPQATKYKWQLHSERGNKIKEMGVRSILRFKFRLPEPFLKLLSPLHGDQIQNTVSTRPTLDTSSLYSIVWGSMHLLQVSFPASQQLSHAPPSWCHQRPAVLDVRWSILSPIDRCWNLQSKSRSVLPRYRSSANSAHTWVTTIEPCSMASPKIIGPIRIYSVESSTQRWQSAVGRRSLLRPANLRHDPSGLRLHHLPVFQNTRPLRSVHLDSKSESVIKNLLQSSAI